MEDNRPARYSFTADEIGMGDVEMDCGRPEDQKKLNEVLGRDPNNRLPLGIGLALRGGMEWAPGMGQKPSGLNEASEMPTDGLS